ncbi:MAG: hypothetical protein ACRD9W_09575 [Terriglobia bacterium]
MAKATKCLSHIALATIVCVAASVLWLVAASGEATTVPEIAHAEQTASELRAAKALDAVRSDPLALYAYLKRMPKGADLHNHLHGAVYAETLIRAGGEDGLCVDPVGKAFTKSQPIRSGAEPEPVCEAGDVRAADVPKDQHLYDALVDSFSMRDFVPSGEESAYDHFFGTFAKFGGTDPSHTGEFLAEVTSRAAAQNEQYLELMATPTWNRLNTVTKDLVWREDLGSLRDELLARGLTEDIPAARAPFGTRRKQAAISGSIATRRVRRPAARSRPATSTRCSATRPRNWYSPKRYSDSSLPRRIRASSRSIS